MPTARNAERVDDPSAAIPVAEGEEPWTAEELAEVREELTGEVARLERAIAIAEAGLKDLFSDGSDGAGRDPADVGSSNFERDQEMSLAQNAKEMLEQAQLALRLFDTGEYGACESCGQPIGKDRLQVFPRATLCLTCKQREERR
ncbi:MAG: TraR/DksA C4-type zinc finger protein [Micropruina sp.]|nr:TraR/DksA C4-type zinc finger protein [Micropruina sp.]